MSSIICDFCSSPNPTWRYPCEDFEVLSPPFGVGSVGGWAACDECAAFIEKKDREGLLNRSVDNFIGIEIIGRRQAKQTIKALHKKFFHLRIGSVERIAS